MHAYCTLLSTKSYLPGVLALHESIRRTATPYPFATAVSADIDPEIDALLEGAGIIVFRIPKSTAIPREMIENNGHWGYTFDKVHLFGLSEFEKLVYVDSDMIVLANMDELFDKPHMSAVPAGLLVHKDWTRLNGGLMVIEPKAGLVDDIYATFPQAIREAASRGLSTIGDQDLLNSFYPDWVKTPELQLDQGYNIFQCHLDQHIAEHGYRLPGEPGSLSKIVKVVHFVGARKPWMKGALLQQFLRALKHRTNVTWESKIFLKYRQLIADVRLRQPDVNAQSTMRMKAGLK